MEKSRYFMHFAQLSVCAAAVVFFMAADAHAQQRSKNRQPQKQGDGQAAPIDLEGTFSAARAGIFEIESAIGEKWQCKPAANAVIIAKAEAPEDFLQKGAYISFTADVNLKKASIEEPIKEVTIFAPIGQCQPGVFLAEHAAELYVSREEMKLKQQMAKGGGMGGMGTGGMGGMEPVGGGAKKQKKEKPPESMELVVRGSIKSLSKTGVMVLTVPQNAFTKTSIKCKLAESPTINAVLTGRTVLEYIKKGDKVTLAGNEMTQAGPNMMQLNYMDVEFSGPLEKPGKKKTTKKTKEEE